MIYAFGTFELDDERFELREGGARVAMQPKVLDVLLFLVRNRARVVMKEELLAAVWSDAAVTEASLTRAMREARRALRDDGEAQGVIATSRGRGYRFAAEVEERGAIATGDTADAGRAAVSEGRAIGRDKLVGRETELRTLLALLDEADARGARMRVVSGESGIGKSRFIEELGERARARGVDVRHVRCERDDAGADFAETLASPPKALTLLLIDDLHLAEPTTLALFDAWLARERERASAKLLVVCTYLEASRFPDAAFERALGGILRYPSAGALSLAGLDDAAVAELLTMVTGASPDAQTVAHLKEKTAGNPLFLRQLAGELSKLDLTSEGPGALAASIQLSHSAISVLARHLDVLSEDARRLLATAAVFGYQFALGAVALAGALSQDRALALLEEARGARVIAKVKGALGVYRFAHPLTRDILYKRLDDDARAKLHAAAGDALITTYRGEVSLHLEEVATQLLAGATAGDVARAIDFATRAAASASDRGRHEHAVWFLSRAREACAFAAPDDRRLHDVVLALANARASAGDDEGARRDFAAAAAIVRAPQG